MTDKVIIKDKATFMQEFLTRNMKNVNTKSHGHYLNVLADTEELGETAYLKYINAIKTTKKNDKYHTKSDKLVQPKV